ncbi:periplasmic binding protein [Methanolacinia petrolearia DSM 11571]|uniref:Periplasmic binding protein n=1 Tax=Methanolacinia petrolearia (strain DSM 11571 / OCM 486 / SEBR 4847) TaxID=679926 RepID=E1RKQ2_METP4|nr:helical backbone metal receptor [Methanolacinia petrolearia]ADN36991.1 periplasmic binding protein [Methanolacinia petrolearia DSM 11571]
MSRWFLRTTLLLFVFIGILLSCSGCTDNITTDNTGSNTSATTSTRVISLAPSETEIFYAINTPDSGISLVGRTDYDDYPPEALSVPSVGGPQTLSIESIVSKDPDLIIGTTLADKTVVDSLKSLGYDVEIYDLETIDDVYSNIESLGEILGLEESAGALVDNMTSRQTAIEDAPKETPAPKTWYVVAVEPLYAAGNNTLQGEMIEEAGGVNVFADMDGYFVASYEAVIERAPEVIIVPSGHGSTTVNFTQQILSIPEFRDLPAVKNGRVYTVDDNTVSRPGPRIIDGLEQFYQCINAEIL